jgi:hypothetical protein
VNDELDDPPTEQELLEAAALARSLEKDAERDPAAPADALDAAALVRAGTHSLELDPARSETILGGLVGELRPRSVRRRWARRAGAVAAVAAVALLIVLPSTRSAEPPRPAPLPRAPIELVTAQLESIRHPAGNDPQLELQLRRYRETLYAELEHRHGRGR